MARCNAEMSQYGEATERDCAFQALFAFRHTAPLYEWNPCDYISSGKKRTALCFAVTRLHSSKKISPCAKHPPDSIWLHASPEPRRQSSR
jgi:hypothetical protein